MTSLGALTTTFEAPAACASSTGIHIVGCGSGCVWWAEGPLDVSECYPSSYNPSLDNYYSPGLCPSGYTPACTSRTSLATLTETIYTCCPTALGYTYRCIGTPDWPWQSSLGCTVYFSDATSTFTFPDATFITDDETMQTSTARTEVGIGAYGIEVRFQRADFASTTSTSQIATTTSSSVAATTTSSSPSTESSTGGATGGTSHGLSAGAGAGIGVGAFAFIALLIGFGVYCFRRKNKAKKLELDGATSGYSDATKFTGPPVSSVPPDYNRWELYGTNPQNSQPQELPTQQRAELG